MKATLKIRQAVRPWLADIADGSTVLVGVSGGADSMALASGILLESQERALTVIPIIIDHGLQADSDRVAQNAAQTLEKIGFHQIEIRRVEVDMKDGLEASARRARYLAFDEAIASFNAVGIFLAHTRNDQAESVLLGLARGSGTRSLSGMAWVNGKYLRPLLDVDREDTQGCCVEQKINYWSDPHNESLEYARVRVRKKILPLLEEEIGPGIVEALARTARILREDADALDEIASEFWLKCSAGSDRKGIEIDISKVEALPKAVRARVLRAAIYSAGAPAGSITADHLAPVEALVTSWRGQGESSLPGGVKVSRISGRLSLSRPE